jgi:hypothetical protein
MYIKARNKQYQSAQQIHKNVQQTHKNVQQAKLKAINK